MRSKTMTSKKSSASLLTKFVWRNLVAIVLLLFALPGSASAQSIPQLNVDPVCHGIAQQAWAPSESGGPDLTYKRCVQSEMATRRKLSREWSTFTPGEKANCIATEMSAPLPSYTDLITCVETARAVRKLNQ
jgi:hypothetical protein